jgi:hypothetical protein
MSHSPIGVHGLLPNSQSEGTRYPFVVFIRECT